jgi:hypothetical protein
MLMTNEITYHNLDQGCTLNFTTSQITPTVGTGNYTGYNLITYNFTGYPHDVSDSLNGMTNITNFTGVNSYVTLANYTGVK